MTTTQKRKRERNGKYAIEAVCEYCQKPTGFNYCSLDTCNDDGIGVVLHDKCAPLMRKKLGRIEVV